jgi:hypothetical protein
MKGFDFSLVFLKVRGSGKILRRWRSNLKESADSFSLNGRKRMACEGLRADRQYSINIHPEIRTMA